MIRLLTAFTAALTAATAQADAHPLRYLELAYSLYNPDWEARENASGLAVHGSYPLTSSLRLTADYNFLETDPVLDRPVQSVRGMPFEDWRTAGIGVFGHGPAETLMTADLSYAAVDVSGETENGFRVMFGVRKSFSGLDAGLGVGYLDLAIEDTIVELELAYELAPRWAATARIQDYADWDFTLYELGFRWRPSGN